MSSHARGVRASADQLREIWTEQLNREYDYICQLYRVPLTRPLIRIEPLGRRWATWDSLARTISVSTQLIETAPWDVVLEILKHEMAHQLVSDRGGTGPSHGRDFALACRKLRVAAWAVSASGGIPDDLGSRSERMLGEEEERLLKRVEKLLALATSSNEHEALLAMQRVQEIYARHDIERLKARRQGEFHVATICFKRQRIDRLKSLVCSILSEHFFVRVIYGSRFDAQALCEFRVAELIGTRANVAMAEYVYGFLDERTEALWREYQKRTRSPGRSRRDYVYGLLMGFREKLSQGQERVMAAAGGDLSQSECRALVALGEREIEDFIADLYPRLGRRRWNTGFTDEDSYAAGVEEGRRIVLSRPVETRGGPAGYLPPGEG
jgi:hypothetical protein